MNTNKWAIGVDIGGTKIAMACVDAQGHILHRHIFPTEAKRGAAAILEDIAQGARFLEKQAGNTPAAMGMGMAGQISEKDGEVIFAPNLGWRHLPLQSEMRQKLGIPVVVLNDVRAATIGEWVHGVGVGANDMICIFIGTGIGGGIVSNGRLVVGASNTAGELGHTVIERKGPACTCGSRGCLEALASGWALTKRAKDRVAADAKAGRAILDKAEGKGELITTRHVIAAYQEGDPLAKELVDDALDAIAIGCVGFVNAFNPSCLILGGGLGLALPGLVDQVHNTIQRYALKAASAAVQVHLSKLQGDAGVVGAAAKVLADFSRA